jgi:hypothetical protein
MDYITPNYYTTVIKYACILYIISTIIRGIYYLHTFTNIITRLLRVLRWIYHGIFRLFNKKLRRNGYQNVNARGPTISRGRPTSSVIFQHSNHNVQHSTELQEVKVHDMTDSVRQLPV